MEPLLSTKLHPPSAPLRLIPRPHLIAQLDEPRALTLLSAPPGFGKTTLLAQWISERMKDEGGRMNDQPVENFHPSSFRLRPSRFAWLSLDEDDNFVPRFLTYLIAALQSANPDIGAGSRLLMQSSPTLEPKTVLSPLLNDIGQLGPTLALILDDYQVIHSKDVHDTIAFILKHIPANLRLILATRSDPPIPLARLRGRAQLIELRTGDLRFSSEETGIFLNQLMGLSLTKEDIHALELQTEGWISGLQMAGFSMQGKENLSQFIASFSGSHRFIGEYLAEEIYNRQSDHIQKFLLQTSILERLCAPLCDALLQWEGEAGEILDRLYTTNVFLLPLDDQGYWFRYHPLFAEFLQARLKRTPLEQQKELHGRASLWFEENGLFGEAVKHALNADEPERAARLVERIAPGMLARGEVRELLHWVDLLPGAVVRTNSRLSLYHAIANFLSGRLEQAEKAVRDAEASISRLAAEDVESVQAEIRAFRLSVSIEGGPRPEDAENAKKLLEQIPQENGLLRTALFFGLGDTYRAVGNLALAKETFAQSRRVAEQSGNLMLALAAEYDLVEVLIELGQLRQAESIHSERIMKVEQRAGGHTPLPVMGGSYIGLGKLLYERNELEAAREHLEKGIQLAQQPGGLGLPRHGLLVLAFVSQAEGYESEARRHLQKAEELVRRSPRKDAMQRFIPEKIHLWLSLGNLSEAARWAEEQESTFNLMDAEQIALARVWLAMGEAGPLEKARQLLADLELHAAEQGHAGRLIESLLLKSLVLHAQKQDQLAAADLEKSIRLAEPEGYVRIFLNEGKPMLELLGMLLMRGVAREYVRGLIDAFTRKSKGRAPQPLVEPLTGRELEVLGLLAGGYTNAEIAERLVIAPGTVKRHTLSIYQKLGVNSRTQAIARARDLNLLS